MRTDESPLPRPLRLTLPLAAALALAGCSGNTSDNGALAAEEPVDTRAVAALFADGFGDLGQASGRGAANRVDRSLGYTPDPAVRRSVAQQLADNLRRNFSLDFAIPDPETFLRSGAAGDIADRKLEALGFPTNGLAGPNVLMFGLAWELANGQPLTAERQRGLRAEVDRQLEDSPLRTKGHADRQREAEFRLQTAALWLEEARLRRGDADRMRQLSDAVQRDMKRMSGNDMRAHDLNPEGFVERSAGSR